VHSHFRLHPPSRTHADKADRGEHQAARKAQNLSLEKLAAKVGAEHWQTLQKLEKGDTAISVDWIERIANALELEPSSYSRPVWSGLRPRGRKRSILTNK
jgi:transcriptional regulator with XRE-family HTH domain